MKTIISFFVSAGILFCSQVSTAQINLGTIKIYNNDKMVSAFNIEDVMSMEITSVGKVTTFEDAAIPLRRAINYMINYANEPLESWTPHKYQFQRSILIDNYAGYWTTTKANFAFSPLMPTLYSENCDYMPLLYDASIPVFSDSRAALVSAEYVGAPYLRALALIVQAYGAQELVDFYGVLPLNDLRVWDGKAVHCESGPEVYKQILTDLDDAIRILKETQPLEDELEKVEGASANKVLFDRQWQRWVKFANSIKLRMALNMVDYLDPDPVYGPDNKPFVSKNIAEEAYNDEIGVLKPGDRDIAYKNTDSDCCLYSIGNSWDDIRLNASMENILKRYNHPLINILFSENNYAITSPDGETAPKGVYGVRAGIMMENILGRSVGYGPFAILNDSMRNMDQPVMKVAEVTFLRAEGALRGWDMGDSAKSLYETGIRESFAEWGLSEEDATSYLQCTEIQSVDYIDYHNRDNDIEGRVAVPVKWSDNDSREVMLEKIITQKWIANFPMGAEAWTTYRRTGYPRIFPVEVSHLNNDNIDIEKQIRRLKFKTKYNSDNLTDEFYDNAAKTLGTQDLCGSPVFWDVNSRTWIKGDNGQYVIDNHLGD